MEKNIFQGKVGLALGGGAALGAVHIGVLKAIEELDISLDAISGTSVGAVVAVLYASGESCEEMERFARDLNWFDVTGFTLSQYGLLTNKKLGDALRERLGKKRIEETSLPVSVVATDISHGEKVILNRGDCVTAVLASTSVPGIFVPIEEGDRFLVDGGLTENVPVSPLKQMGVSTIIGVDLNANRSFTKPDTIVSVLRNSFDIAQMYASRLQRERADIVIAPDVTEYSLFLMSSVPDLIDTGYRAALEVLGANLDGGNRPGLAAGEKKDGT